MYEVTSPVFAAYADKFKDDKLADMILAANYLEFTPLMELLSAKLAITLSTMNI
jgi:hypothetical protein